MTTEPNCWRLGNVVSGYQDIGVLVLLRRYRFIGKSAGYHAGPSGRAIQNLSSWAKVVFYAYSALLALSKRGSRNKPPQLLRPAKIPIITSIIGVTVSTDSVLISAINWKPVWVLLGYWS